VRSGPCRCASVIRAHSTARSRSISPGSSGGGGALPTECAVLSNSLKLGSRLGVLKLALLTQTSRRDPSLQTADLVRFAKCSKSAALRSLEDLDSLGVVDRDGPRSACEWAIRARFADVLRPFGSRA